MPNRKQRKNNNASRRQTQQARQQEGEVREQQNRREDGEQNAEDVGSSKKNLKTVGDTKRRLNFTNDRMLRRDATSKEEDDDNKWSDSALEAEENDDSGIETSSFIESHRYFSDTEDASLYDGATVCSDDFEPIVTIFDAALKRRSLRVDDVLWLICFAMTIVFLDVPNVLLFNRRVHGNYLAYAALCVSICALLAFYIRVLSTISEKLALKNLLFMRLAFMSSLFGGAILFCVATWTVYHVWSIYIALVSTFTFLAVIAIV